MMAPDYAHWHGMYEVAERFYQHLIPEAREISKQAAEKGRTAEAQAVNDVIDKILARMVSEEETDCETEEEVATVCHALTCIAE